MLRSQGLRFRYVAGGPTLAFPDVALAAGEQALVLGASGAGKSTLLGLWSGLLSPEAGEIEIGHTRVDRLRGAARDRWRGATVGFVYQSPRLLGSQRVAANVELPRRLSAKPVSRADTLAALARLGVAHLAERFPDACSVGEQQRVGILRALAHEPALILADEPTSALDHDNALRVGRLLCEQARAHGATLIVVTHDERLAPLFTRTIRLEPAPPPTGDHIPGHQPTTLPPR